MESHAHRFAKELLADWLRTLSATRSRRGPETSAWPDFGEGRVFVEYPLTADGSGLDMLWDENGHAFGGAVPTYDDLCGNGTPPVCIFDIVTTHKGNISAAIEIVHKNSLTQQKLQRLAELQDLCPRGGFEVWTVPAHWVLGQIGVPAAFAGTRVL